MGLLQPVDCSLQPNSSSSAETLLESTSTGFHYLEIHAVDNDDGIVLGADVIANHLNYLFETRDPSERHRALNWPAAIKKHPLKDHLDAFNDWGSGDFIGDGVYKHPKAP